MISAILISAQVMYCAPVDTFQVLKVPFENGSVSLLEGATPANDQGTPSASDQYSGPSCVASTTAVYCAPHTANHVLKVSFADDSVTPLTDYTLSGSAKYWGACDSSTTAMYCAPFNADHVLKVGFADDSVTQLATSPDVDLSLISSQYIGSCASSTAAMYCAPYKAADVLKVSFADDSVTQLAIPGLVTTVYNADNHYAGGCQTSTTAMYCAPNTRDGSVLKVLFATDGVMLLAGPQFSSNDFGEACAASTTAMYCAPNMGDNVLKVNFADDSITLLTGPTLTQSQQYTGRSCMTSVTAMFCSPFSADYVLKAGIPHCLRLARSYVAHPTPDLN